MKTTACLACKHLLNISTSSDINKASEWYYNYCKASPRPKSFNFLTGQFEKPNPEYDYCRDINKGNCPLFEAKDVKINAS